MKIFEFPIRLSLVMVALIAGDHHIRAQDLADSYTPLHMPEPKGADNHSPLPAAVPQVFSADQAKNHSPLPAAVLQVFSAGAEYITEWQTDFRGAYNWANLLRLSADIRLSSTFSLQAATLSISQTNQDPIVDDLQGFSNIAEDNCALTLAMLGFGWQTDCTKLFVGIRNVNEDYFTTPFTSLFTNSSCGIYPTLAHNYEIANYPLSSWSVHFAQAWDALTLNLSVYNGRGYQRFTGHDNMFRLSPKNDGVFTITSITHQKNDCHYTFGLAAFYGVHTPEMGRDAFTEISSTEARLQKLGYDPTFEGQAFRQGTLSASTDPQSPLGPLHKERTRKEGRLLAYVDQATKESRLPACVDQATKESRLPACAHQPTKESRLPACAYQPHKESRLLACAHQPSPPSRSPLPAAEPQVMSTAPAPSKKLSFAPWLCIEQTLTERWQLMLQASMSTYRHGCRYFAGAGLKYTISDIDIALFADYARYTDDHEIAAELTTRIPLSSKSYLQPAVHFITTNSDPSCVALLRYGLEF